MSNPASVAPKTNNNTTYGVKDLISHSNTFSSEFVGYYYNELSKGFIEKSDKLEDLGKRLVTSTRIMVESTIGLMNNSTSPQAKQHAKETAAASEKIAIAFAEGASKAHIEAGRYFHKAMEATKAAKTAGLAGNAVSGIDLVMQVNTATKTGDWNEVGKTLAGLGGGYLAAKMAAAAIAVSGAALPIATAALIVGAVAIAGDIAGKMAWDAFADDILDWLPDSFAQWFDIPNRTGQHYFYDPLVLDLDGDDTELAA